MVGGVAGLVPGESSSSNNGGKVCDDGGNGI